MFICAVTVCVCLFRAVCVCCGIFTPNWKVLRNLLHSAPFEVLFQMVLFLSKVKILVFGQKSWTMYNPWFFFWESEKSFEISIPRYRKQKEKSNDACFSRIAPSSVEL